MALSFIQQSNILHGIGYDTYFSTLSSIYAADGFKYIYYISTSAGIIGTIKTFPWTNGYGIFNPNQIMKNQVGYTFTPTNILFKKSTDIKAYLLNVAETITGTTITSSYYDKKLAIRADREDFNYNLYFLNASNNQASQFLTQQKMKH